MTGQAFLDLHSSSPSSDLLNAFRVGVGMPSPAGKEHKKQGKDDGNVDEWRLIRRPGQFQFRPISASIPHLNFLALMLVFQHTSIN